VVRSNGGEKRKRQVNHNLFDEEAKTRRTRRNIRQERARVENAIASQPFGVAWVAFTVAIAIHVADEVKHNFLATYNPSVMAIRSRLPFLPLPTFSFRMWLGLLIAGIALLFFLSPLAFRGSHWLRLVSQPLAVVVGVLNAAVHLGGSAYFRRLMPGVYSAPLLMAAAIYLLATS
jgi:hypothetical protein